MDHCRKWIFSIFLFFSGFEVNSQSFNPLDTVRIKGYFSVVHPIGSFDKEGGAFNFSDSYLVGFPCGVTFLDSEKLALSIEFVPNLQFTDSTSEMTGLLFHPGVIFRNRGSFNFLARAAFNTNGRYGFTLIINKTLFKSESKTYFLAMPIPFRFGAYSPASITIGLQFGMVFWNIIPEPKTFREAIYSILFQRIAQKEGIVSHPLY